MIYRWLLDHTLWMVVFAAAMLFIFLIRITAIRDVFMWMILSPFKLIRLLFSKVARQARQQKKAEKLFQRL